MYLVSALLFYYKDNNYNSSLVTIGMVSDEWGKKWGRDQAYFWGHPMSFDEFADFCLSYEFDLDFIDFCVDSVCIVIKYFEVKV